VLENFQAYYQESNFGRTHELQVFKREGDRIAAFSAIELKEYESGELYNPGLVADRNTMQSIFDALYEAGYRPTKPRVDETPARDAHLEDMRRLVEVAYKFSFDHEEIAELDENNEK